MTVKLDIYGSTQTNSLNRLRTRAVRRGIVRGVSNDLDGLQEAIDDIAAEPNVLTHPNITAGGINALPLQDITVRRFGPNKCFAWLNYYRIPIGPFSEFVEPNQAQQIGRISFGETEYVEWYRTTGNDGTDYDAGGYPNGPINGIIDKADPEVRPVPYELPVRGWRFVVPFVSSSVDNLDSLIGKTNNSSVTYGGKLFPIGSLIFVAPTFDIYRDFNGNTFFAGAYVFKFFPNGLARQITWYNEDIAGNELYDNALPDDEWVTAKVLAAPSANFLTFPGST